MSDKKIGESCVETEVKTTKRGRKKLSKVEKWFRFLRRFYKSWAWFLLPFRPHGTLKKYNDRSYIIVGNHRSVLDVIPSILITDKPVHFMAKKELFKKGFMKWFTKKSECIPVSRDGTDVRAIMQAIKYIKEGSVVCIFPEGTRNKTQEMFLPFKSGAAALAIKTKTPVIPMVQIKKIRFFRAMHIYYGEPFEFTEFYDKKLSQEDFDAADLILRQKLEECYFKLNEDLTKKKKCK